MANDAAGLHVLLVESYNSALVRKPPRPNPPTTSTLPEGSNVAVWLSRAVERDPALLNPLARPGRAHAVITNANATVHSLTRRVDDTKFFFQKMQPPL